MSGVELIVAALAAGASAGMTNTATAAVQDAYTGLKKLLGRWVAGREQAPQVLEADETDPDVWQARLGEELTSSGAAADEQVLAAAMRLLALADPQKAKTINIKVDQNYGAVGEFSGPVTFNQGQPVPQHRRQRAEVTRSRPYDRPADGHRRHQLRSGWCLPRPGPHRRAHSDQMAAPGGCGAGAG